MIGAVVGLLTLLSALVLGLLIWTAYGVYSGQNIAVQTLAAKLLQLDHALIDYGPDADAGRTQLKQDLERTSGAFGTLIRAPSSLQQAISLTPTTICAASRTTSNL